MHLYFDERTAQLRAAKPIQIFEPTIVCWYGNEKRGVEVTAVADNPTPVVNRDSASVGHPSAVDLPHSMRVLVIAFHQ